MAVTVLSQQGDTVDLICHRHYGYTAGITEQVLDLNPGLAARGPVLPAGVTITLPDTPTRAAAGNTVNLWD
jgi:phage tail protein X